MPILMLMPVLILALALRLGLAQDKTRTGTYKQAILAHADECFKDKVVLDVGCGTGTLAIAAQRRQPGVRVAGLDADPAVLAVAARKAAMRVCIVLLTLRAAAGDATPHWSPLNSEEPFFTSSSDFVSSTAPRPSVMSSVRFLFQ